MMKQFKTDHNATDSLWCYFQDHKTECTFCSDPVTVSIHGGHLGDSIIYLCDDCSGMVVSLIDRLEPWVDPDCFDVPDRMRKFIIILETTIEILKRKID